MTFSPFYSLSTTSCNYCTSFSCSNSKTKYWVAKVLSKVFLILSLSPPGLEINFRGFSFSCGSHCIQIFRYQTTLMEKRDIFNSWHCKIPPYISRHLSSKSFVEDSVSQLLHILSPPTLRPVIAYVCHGHSLSFLHFHSFSYLLYVVILQLIDTWKIVLENSRKNEKGSYLPVSFIFLAACLSEVSCNFHLISS